MRFNFKKISAIATSVLLTGMTLGVAAAANYPAPFVSGSSADVAIVYGTGSGVSQLDQVEASNIQRDLQDELPSGAISVSGGESFTLEDGNDVFNFAENLASVYEDLGEEEMDFLNDGTYDDGDIDEDYSQTLDLNSGGVLTLFADRDYNDDEPTLGIHYEEGDEILSYTIEFDDTISMEDMADTEVPLFGKNYYVLDVENGTGATLTLLDSADKVVISEDETLTVNGKAVSIAFIDEDEVKFTVGGETTDKLEDHEFEELDDGSYIVANEVLYSSKETGVSSAEFSIGSGKLILENTKEIEANDDTVEELYVDFDVSGDDLTSITITWKADDDLFLTEDNSLTMPLFEAISLVFEGMDFPSDSEVISFTSGDDLVIEMDNFDIPVMTAGTADAIYMGEDGNILVTAAQTLSANYTGEGYNNITVLTGGLNLQEDDRFVITYIDQDLGDVEQVYYEVSSIDYNADDDITLDLTDLIGDDDMSFDEIEDDDIPGTNINVNITGMNDSSVYLNFTSSDGAVSFNKLVSDTGLLITLPAKNRVQTVDLSSDVIIVQEQDKDGDVGEGLKTATIDISNSSNDKLYADTSDSNITIQEELSDDNYIGYFETDLATKVTMDQSGDEYDLELEYFADEVTATVKVVANGEVSSESGALGNVVVMDSEVSSMSNKNLIIVGGSCINSAAANVLGGSYCGPAFTSATGVGAGQYLIKSVASPYNSAKVALLVAGYEVADTQAASTYLRTKTVDTTAGKEGIGTTGVAGTITFA